MRPDDASAVPPPPARSRDGVVTTPRPALRLRTDVGALSHVGKVRETNEDNYLVCRIGRFLERVSSSLPEAALPARTEESNVLLIVADGMGGMAAGEVASQTALATLVRLILGSRQWARPMDDPETRSDQIAALKTRAREFVAAVHTAVRTQAASHPALAGMGTTLTCAYTVGADLFVTHIGDSRAYLWHEGEVRKITRDQTVAQTYVEMGILNEHEARSHRMSHVLTQAVGGPDDTLEADMFQVDIAPGDRLLLCSDGLTNAMEIEEIAEVLGGDTSAQQACERLVEMALDYGGTDNVTALVARYEAE